MAETRPPNPHNKPVVGQSVKEDGSVSFDQADDHGRKKTAIHAKLGTRILVWPLNGSKAALTASAVAGKSIGLETADREGKTHWVLECLLTNRGAGITRVDVDVQVSFDGGTTWITLQTESISSGAITLSDAVFRKAVAAAANWICDFETAGAPRFRVRAHAGAGGPAGSEFAVYATPSSL